MEEEIKVYENFDEMNLKESLLRGIYKYGFEKPSDIQKQGIVLVTSGKDVVIQAKSGTGKTGTFLIGLLNNINESELTHQAMVLLPTIELAKQVFEVCKALAHYTKIKTVISIGGEPIQENINNLSTNNPTIIIGTPGRLRELMEKNIINRRTLITFAIDEADEMLSQGFVDTVRDIVSMIPKKTQICLFSATLPTEIVELTNKFMRDPIKILIKPEELTLDGIKQYYIISGNNDEKYELFKDLFHLTTINQTIVYVNSKKLAVTLRNKLELDNFTVSIIHSKMTHPERDYVMNEFRKGNIKLLISTDLLSRGIDIQSVYIVINYELPFRNVESYLHRIGRSGRFGRKGVAINLVNRKDYHLLENITKYYSTIIDPFPENNIID